MGLLEVAKHNVAIFLRAEIIRLNTIVLSVTNICVWNLITLFTSSVFLMTETEQCLLCLRVIFASSGIYIGILFS